MSMQQLTGSRATWINIERPSMQDVEALRQLYPYIHPLNLEDVVSSIERPKVDDEAEYLFVVLHFPLWDAVNRLTRASEVDLFVGRGYVVTIHDGTLKPLKELYQQCMNSEKERETLLGSGASHTFYVMVDRLVDYIFPILRKMDSNLRAIEETIFTVDDRTIIRDIALTRRDIIALRRIIRQLVPVMENLEHVERQIIHEDLEDYFSDIVDHLYRARDIIDEDTEVIAGLSETADMLLSHRINGVIRILTVFSVIMLPLTFISSVYGMNIGFLPFADHPYSFWIVNGIMLLTAVTMLYYFRKRKWL